MVHSKGAVRECSLLLRLKHMSHNILVYFFQHFATLLPPEILGLQAMKDQS
jgi:hypothetical protein